MRIRLAAPASALATLLVCSCAGGRSGYLQARNGADLHQCRLPILFAVEATLPAPVETAVIEAFEYWEGLSPRRLFVYAGRVPFGPDAPEAYGLVVVGISAERHRGGWHPTSFTRIRRVTDPRGCISSAEIYLHPGALGLPAVALASALRHEVGHVLGLDHSDDPASLMYPRTPRHALKGVSEGELRKFLLYYE